MNDVLSAVKFVRSCGLNHKELKAVLGKIKVKMAAVYYSKLRRMPRFLFVLEKINTFHYLKSTTS
jgi:hypothetical protein